MPQQRSVFYQAAKRSLDLSVAMGMLVVLAPVIALVAVFVRIFMGRPVVFRHPRPGLDGKVFECLKFRTMTNARSVDGALLSEGLRLTKFGRFLRSTSLDELPQLLTVVSGEMSLVGPRPLEVRYVPRYTPEQSRRHSVKPGITGWAQVNGRNAIDWDRRLALDIWYVENCSFSLDLKILAFTLWKVITAAGVAKPGQVSCEEFMGTAASTAPNRVAAAASGLSRRQ